MGPVVLAKTRTTSARVGALKGFQGSSSGRPGTKSAFRSEPLSTVMMKVVLAA